MSSQTKPCPGLPGEEACPYKQIKKPGGGYCCDCTRAYYRRRYRKQRVEAGLPYTASDTYAEDEIELLEPYKPQLTEPPPEDRQASLEEVNRDRAILGLPPLQEQA